MNFLSDYWLYHSCYEIPRLYAIWSGIGLVNSVINNQVVYLHGDLEMWPPMYIGLIGSQGISKSTCCGIARGLFRESCADLEIGPSRASPESIVKMMSEDSFMRTFTNAEGDRIEVRPLAFFVNELKNFVGRSPIDMLTFLTDVYNEKFYKNKTLLRGDEGIINPAISLLCCETPDWITRNIKGEIISGGFGRRIVYVYVIETPDPVPFPFLSKEAKEAKDRCRQRLKDMRKVSGEVKWEPKAFRLHDKWYRENNALMKSESNPIMKGYLKSKNVQLYKVMMGLDACSDKPNLQFTVDLLEEGLSYLNILDPNILALFAASGKNELLYAQKMVIDFLERVSQWVAEATVKRMLENELSPTDTYYVLRHLEETEQIVKKQVNFPNRQGPVWGIATMGIYNKMLLDGDIAIRKKNENGEDKTRLPPLPTTE